MSRSAYIASVDREKKLRKLLKDLSEERERLGTILFELEGEPEVSASLARIDMRLAGIVAQTEEEFSKCSQKS